MFSGCLLIAGLCTPFVAAIAILPPPSLNAAQMAKYTTTYGLSDSESQFHHLRNAPAKSVPFDLGGPRTNTTFSLSDTNEVAYQCSSEDYGIPLPAACRDAYHFVPTDTDSSTFGDRSNPDDYDVFLPWRVISADGTCFIEVTYAEPGGSDRELVEKIKLAAFTLVTFCVQGKHSGGIARGLGQHGKLEMTIQQYEPNVQCSNPSGNPPDFESCQAVMATIPAELQVQKFGKRGTPGIDVALTAGFATADLKCVLKVGINGAPRNARWYDFYAAAVAVLGMCVVNDKDGVAILDGHRFAVRFQNESPRLTLPAATA